MPAFSPSSEIEVKLFFSLGIHRRSEVWLGLDRFLSTCLTTRLRRHQFTNGLLLNVAKQNGFVTLLGITARGTPLVHLIEEYISLQGFYLGCGVKAGIAGIGAWPSR